MKSVETREYHSSPTRTSFFLRISLIESLKQLKTSHKFLITEILCMIYVERFLCPNFVEMDFQEPKWTRKPFINF